MSKIPLNVSYSIKARKSIPMDDDTKPVYTGHNNGNINDNIIPRPNTSMKYIRPISKPTKKYDIKNTLNHFGYEITSKIGKSLQGYVFIGKKTSNKQKIIIKVTSKELYAKGITLLNKKHIIRIKENIIKEAKIMKYLTKKTPCIGLTEYIDCFSDIKNYILIQNYCGTSLFDYINMNFSKYNISVWKEHIKKLFKQMVIFICWLHSHNVCHLDISLENCVINTKTFIVSFIDYGLSEYFKNNEFKCNKFGCGKTRYLCDEVYNGNGKYKYFLGNKADIWSLGVCLWMMLTKCPLYQKPIYNDIVFYRILKGNLKYIVNKWSLNDRIDKECCHLLSKIFTFEKKRININDILTHEYIYNVITY